MVTQRLDFSKHNTNIDVEFPWLVLLAPNEHGEWVIDRDRMAPMLLPLGNHLVGTDATRCLVVLPSVSVSGIHCSVIVNLGGYVKILDINSTNGTYEGSQPGENQLTPGEVCDVEFDQPYCMADCVVMFTRHLPHMASQGGSPKREDYNLDAINAAQPPLPRAAEYDDTTQLQTLEDDDAHPRNLTRSSSSQYRSDNGSVTIANVPEGVDTRDHQVIWTQEASVFQKRASQEDVAAAAAVTIFNAGRSPPKSRYLETSDISDDDDQLQTSAAAAQGGKLPPLPGDVGFQPRPSAMVMINSEETVLTEDEEDVSHASEDLLAESGDDESIVDASVAKETTVSTENEPSSTVEITPQQDPSHLLFATMTRTPPEVLPMPPGTTPSQASTQLVNVEATSPVMTQARAVQASPIILSPVVVVPVFSLPPSESSAESERIVTQLPPFGVNAAGLLESLKNHGVSPKLGKPISPLSLSTSERRSLLPVLVPGIVALQASPPAKVVLEKAAVSLKPSAFTSTTKRVKQSPSPTKQDVAMMVAILEEQLKVTHRAASWNDEIEITAAVAGSALAATVTAVEVTPKNDEDVSKKGKAASTAVAEVTPKNSEETVLTEDEEGSSHISEDMLAESGDDESIVDASVAKETTTFAENESSSTVEITPLQHSSHSLVATMTRTPSEVLPMPPGTTPSQASTQRVNVEATSPVMTQARAAQASPIIPSPVVVVPVFSLPPSESSAESERIVTQLPPFGVNAAGLLESLKNHGVSSKLDKPISPLSLSTSERRSSLPVLVPGIVALQASPPAKVVLEKAAASLKPSVFTSTTKRVKQSPSSTKQDVAMMMAILEEQLTVTHGAASWKDELGMTAAVAGSATTATVTTAEVTPKNDEDVSKESEAATTAAAKVTPKKEEDVSKKGEDETTMATKVTPKNDEDPSKKDNDATVAAAKVTPKKDEDESKKVENETAAAFKVTLKNGKDKSKRYEDVTFTVGPPNGAMAESRTYQDESELYFDEKAKSEAMANAKSQKKAKAGAKAVPKIDEHEKDKVLSKKDEDGMIKAELKKTVKAVARMEKEETGKVDPEMTAKSAAKTIQGLDEDEKATVEPKKKAKTLTKITAVLKLAAAEMPKDESNMTTKSTTTKVAKAVGIEQPTNEDSFTHKKRKPSETTTTNSLLAKRSKSMDSRASSPLAPSLLRSSSIKVMFTNVIPTSEMINSVKSLTGLIIASDSELQMHELTHLICLKGSLKRTLKFLQVMAMHGPQAPRVVHVDWLADSVKNKRPLDTAAYAPFDGLFSMKEALERRDRDVSAGLLAGMSVLVCVQDVAPSFKELKPIVELMGGQCLLLSKEACGELETGDANKTIVVGSDTSFKSKDEKKWLVTLKQRKLLWVRASYLTHSLMMYALQKTPEHIVQY